MFRRRVRKPVRRIARSFRSFAVSLVMLSYIGCATAPPQKAKRTLTLSEETIYTMLNRVGQLISIRDRCTRITKGDEELLKRKLEELDVVDDSFDSVLSMFDFASRNLKYDHRDGLHRGIAQVLEEQKGDCDEKSNVLAAMLGIATKREIMMVETSNHAYLYVEIYEKDGKILETIRDRYGIEDDVFLSMLEIIEIRGKKWLALDSTVKIPGLVDCGILDKDCMTRLTVKKGICGKKANELQFEVTRD